MDRKNKNTTPSPVNVALQQSLLFPEVEKPPNGDPPRSIDLLNNPDEDIGNRPHIATEVAGPAGGGRQAATIAMAAEGDGDGGGRKTFAEEASEAAQARAIAETRLRQANAEVGELRQEQHKLKGELKTKDDQLQQKDAVINELMRTLKEKRDEMTAVKAEHQMATDAAVAAVVERAMRDADAAAEAQAGAKRQADDAVAALQRELRAAIAARDAAPADAVWVAGRVQPRHAVAAVVAARARVLRGDGVTTAMRRAAEKHVDAHAGDVWRALHAAVDEKKDWPLARAVQHVIAARHEAAHTARSRDAWLGSVTDRIAVNALYWASSNDAPKDVKVGVLAIGVSARGVDHHGQTGLHGAAWGGDEEFAELLIALGADVNAKRVKEGHTPLHYAAWDDKLALIRVLVRAGADVSVRTTDEHNETARQLAKRLGLTASETALTALEAAARS